MLVKTRFCQNRAFLHLIILSGGAGVARGQSGYRPGACGTKGKKTQAKVAGDQFSAENGMLWATKLWGDPNSSGG